MPTTTSCPRCGESLRDGESSCGQCGARVHPCPGCDEAVMDGDRFCSHCRTPQPNAEPEGSPWDEVLDRLRKATVGEFVIKRELGRGGMAAVYLAHDISLNRKVAVKVMSPGLMMGLGMVERFKQEAVTVANLSHPHIVTIHAVRQIAGLHFFVMKLIPGRSLERVIAESGPLPVALTQAILFQVGSALAYAHRRGVIHRDVKPGNILMDEDGNAIVTDFGIAKVRESPTHTMTGATVGTPAYMSPEQCWSREVSGASDQYSLGIVAYEMLTGAPPFVGPTLGILRAHVEDTARPLADVRPDCPPDLAAGIARMLAKEPGDRWPDMMRAVTGLGGRHLAEHDPIRDDLAAIAMSGSTLDATTSLRTPVSPIPSTQRPGSAPVTAVVVTTPSGQAPVGETLQLHAVGHDAAGVSQPGSQIRWTSSDPTVATVSISGLVTPLAPGNVTITAAADDGPAGVTIIEVTPPAPTTAEVTGAPGELGVGESVPLGLLVRDARQRPLTARGVRWVSSDPGVLAVTEAGVARALAPGTATLTGSAEGGVAAAAIVVVRPAAITVVMPPVVATLELAGAPSQWYPGDVAHLRALARDAAGAPLVDRAVEWGSDAPQVASVSTGGVVTAVGEGNAHITATCEGRREVVEVRVSPSPVAAIAVAAPGRPLSAGRRLRLRAELRDARGVVLRGRAVRWSSEDASIAEVDAASGDVRGVAAGSVAVVAASEQSQGRTRVTVVPATPVPWRRMIAGGGAIAALALAIWIWPDGGNRPVGTGSPPAFAGLTLAPSAGELEVGGSLQLTPSFVAADGSPAEARPLTWTTSDSTVVAISPEGIASGRAPGAAMVTATSDGRQGRASLRVRPTGSAGPAAGEAATIAVSDAPSRVVVRDTFSLAARVLDGAGAALADAPVGWRSSKPVVATISATGQVTALTEGTTTLTATSGGRSASLTLRVAGQPVASVAVTPTSPSLGVGESAQLTATIVSVRGDTLRGKVAIWTSSDAAVATVSPAGVVTAVGPGRATITVTSGGVRGVAVLTATDRRAPVAAIVVAPSELRLRVGDTARATAILRDARGSALTGRGIVWRMASPARIADVGGATGLVTAVARGRAQLVAESEGVSATIPVIVGDTAPPDNGGAPPATRAALAVRAVAAGGWTCGIATDGATACWGQGQAVPARISGDRFSQISAGLGFACGLSAGGQAYCWGANGKGQLGDGSTKSHAAPALVSADLTFTQVSAGETHACGLTPGGNVYCWGSNGEGQLGDGSKDGRTRPTQIRESQPWKLVAAGGQHSCALTAQGRAYCWGDGFSGELGQGMVESSLEPVAVTGGLSFTGLTAGHRHTCGLTVGREAYCWGDNRDGQLGNGGGEDADKPVAVAGGLEFTELSAGSIHTCGVTTAGRVACWGANTSGQLGVGAGGGRGAPAQVRIDAPVAHVSAGSAHTCAVTREQALFCWGANNRGQLGDGTQVSRPTPGPVQGGAAR